MHNYNAKQLDFLGLNPLIKNLNRMLDYVIMNFRRNILGF